MNYLNYRYLRVSCRHFNQIRSDLRTQTWRVKQFTLFRIKIFDGLILGRIRRLTWIYLLDGGIKTVREGKKGERQVSLLNNYWPKSTFGEVDSCVYYQFFRQLRIQVHPSYSQLDRNCIRERFPCPRCCFWCNEEYHILFLSFWPTPFECNDCTRWCHCEQIKRCVLGSWW